MRLLIIGIGGALGLSSFSTRDTSISSTLNSLSPMIKRIHDSVTVIESELDKNPIVSETLILHQNLERELQKYELELRTSSIEMNGVIKAKKARAAMMSIPLRRRTLLPVVQGIDTLKVVLRSLRSDLDLAVAKDPTLEDSVRKFSTIVAKSTLSIVPVESGGNLGVLGGLHGSENLAATQLSTGLPTQTDGGKKVVDRDEAIESDTVDNSGSPTSALSIAEKQILAPLPTIFGGGLNAAGKAQNLDATQFRVVASIIE